MVYLCCNFMANMSLNEDFERGTDLSAALYPFSRLKTILTAVCRYIPFVQT